MLAMVIEKYLGFTFGDIHILWACCCYGKTKSTLWIKQVYLFRWITYSNGTRCSLIFLHSCKIKSGSNLGIRIQLNLSAHWKTQPVKQIKWNDGNKVVADPYTILGFSCSKQLQRHMTVLLMQLCSANTVITWIIYMFIVQWSLVHC